MSSASPQIIYYVASSLDGYIATPDGSVEWLAPFEDSEEDYGYNEFYASIEAVLLGSRTFEQLLTFDEWPYADKPTWVFSRRSRADLPPNVTVTDAGAAEVVSDAQSRGLQRLWLVGGAALAASFRNAGLITEYIVSIMPVLLGDGVPLFAEPGPQQSLKLVGSTVYQDGVVQCIYRPQ